MLINRPTRDYHHELYLRLSDPQHEGNEFVIMTCVIYRVSTGLENPGKSLNWKKIPGLESL